MLRLRPYKSADADAIAAWLTDEDVFYKWSAGRFGAYPITASDIRQKYEVCNGDCADADNFYPFTAFDEDGVAGHMTMRFTDGARRVVRFGYVIVADSRRGRGYGREMMRLALRYAFDILRADKVTIGVFANNPAAHRCYLSVGFSDVGEDFYQIRGEHWRCIEMEHVGM